MRHVRAFVVLALALALPLFAGCVQTGGKWDHKVVLASDLTPTAVEGQWEGSWQSYEYFDNGLIHFVTKPVDASGVTPEYAATPGTVRFNAHVKLWHYGVGATEEFDMVLIATAESNGQIRFHGDRNLGPLKGFCKFDGFAEGNKSSISYVSREDFGSVTMHRVVDAP